MRIINTNKQRSNDFLLSGFDYTSNPDYMQRYLDEIYNDDNFFTMEGQVTTFVKKKCLDKIMLYFAGRIQSIPDPRFTELLKYELSSAEYLFYQMLARDTVLKDAEGLFGGEWRRSKQETETDIGVAASSNTKQDSNTDNSVDSETRLKTGEQNIQDRANNTMSGQNHGQSSRYTDMNSGARIMSNSTGGRDRTESTQRDDQDVVNRTKSNESASVTAKADGTSTNRAGNISSAFPMSALPNEGGTVDSFLHGTSGTGQGSGESAGNAMKYASAGGQNMGQSDNKSNTTSDSQGEAKVEGITGSNADRTTKGETIYGKSENSRVESVRDTGNDNTTYTDNRIDMSSIDANKSIGARDDSQTVGAVSNTKGSYDAKTDRNISEDRSSKQETFSEGSSKPFIELLNGLNDVTKGYTSAFEFIQGRLEDLFNQVFGTWYPDHDDGSDGHYPL